MGVEDTVEAHVEADHGRIIGLRRHRLEAVDQLVELVVNLRGEPVTGEIEGIEFDPLADLVSPARLFLRH
jgi:hypothetical protein